jgi:glycosyltransferase involved in cell wall biosynthesis
MACGVPVAGSDSGEIPHVLAGCGVVVPEKDESAWTRTLGELLENPSRRGELSTGGELAAREYYSWDEVGRQYLAFFDELLDAPAAAATR